MAYRWSDAAGRFVDASGKYVSEAAVRRVIDAIADGVSAQMALLSERLVAGEISLASWQLGMQGLIRAGHVATGVIGHGGAARMNAQRWGRIGPIVRQEYGYLAGFAQAVANGKQPMTPGLVARAALYGQATRVTFENLRREDQRNRGFLYERNVLSVGENCRQCRQLSAQGWVPIGTTPPVGTRTCRANDRCRIVFSKVLPTP